MGMSAFGPKPASWRWRENTGPEAPVSSVRSRSKIAAWVTMRGAYRPVPRRRSATRLSSLWHARDHGEDVEQLEGDNRSNVSGRHAATFDGNGTELFDERPTRLAQLVSPSPFRSSGSTSTWLGKVRGVEVSGITNTVLGRNRRNAFDD